MVMKVDVWFGPDNKLTVEAAGDDGSTLLDMVGSSEEVTEVLKADIAYLECRLKAAKTALARILYTPICWG
jgi:hypothetical protein